MIIVAKASRKIGSVIAVICGCLGAGWLFSYGLETFVNWIFGYKIGSNLISYIFNGELYCLALLMLAITFFVTAIKDLNIIKKGVVIFSTVVSAVTLVWYSIRFFSSTWNFSVSFWENAAMVVLLISYILFFIYHMGNKKFQNVAWAMGLIGAIGLFVVYCMQISSNVLSANQFVFYLFKCLSHVAVFYCGLKRY